MQRKEKESKFEERNNVFQKKETYKIMRSKCLIA